MKGSLMGSFKSLDENLILYVILYRLLCVFLYVFLCSKTKENISVCRIPQRETLKDPD